MDTVLELATQVSDAIDREAGAYYGDRTNACDRCNGMLAIAASRHGHTAEVAYGFVGDEDHVWAIIDGIHTDIAGQQFGLPKVQVGVSYSLDYTLPVSEMVQEMYPEDLAIAHSV